MFYIVQFGLVIRNFTIFMNHSNGQQSCW